MEDRPRRPFRAVLTTPAGESNLKQTRIGGFIDPKRYPVLKATKISLVTDDVYGVWAQIAYATKDGGVPLAEGEIARTSPTGGDARRVQREIFWHGDLPLFGLTGTFNTSIFNYSGVEIETHTDFFMVDRVI